MDSEGAGSYPATLDDYPAEYQEGLADRAASSESSAVSEERFKKWTAPQDRSRAKILYNYLLSRSTGSDIFGKRMGSSYPMRKFRFFTSGASRGSGIHGSEFLGKRNSIYSPARNNVGISEFLGKRARVSEFLGKRSETTDSPWNSGEVKDSNEKRARVSEFLGKRARVSEFLGKRARVSEFLGKRNSLSDSPDKRARVSEFLGKRARVSEFLGKRNSEAQKRARVSEFLGKRPDPFSLYGKRARISEFLGKRLPFDYKNRRPRVSEFLGKRSRVSEFLGKRSVADDVADTYNESSGPADFADVEEEEAAQRLAGDNV